MVSFFNWWLYINEITIAYFIGNTLGIIFSEKYGHYVHLSPKKLENISVWFNKYREKLLIFVLLSWEKA